MTNSTSKVDSVVDQMSTEPHYQSHSGVDWIARCSDKMSPEGFRGAMCFTIGKYLDRYGRKDSTHKEAKKVLDYATRLYEFEIKLHELDKGES